MTYVFTKSAKQDLKKIWQYTDESWGEEQANNYTASLKQCCENLCVNPALGKPLYNIHKALKVHLCQHHYIFFLKRSDDLLIIAFLHEKMDALRHIQQRL